jgi:hypothetical protein
LDQKRERYSDGEEEAEDSDCEAKSSDNNSKTAIDLTNTQILDPNYNSYSYNPWSKLSNGDNSLASIIDTSSDGFGQQNNLEELECKTLYHNFEGVKTTEIFLMFPRVCKQIPAIMVRISEMIKGLLHNQHLEICLVRSNSDALNW